MSKFFKNNQLLIRLILSYLLSGTVLTGLLMFLVSGFVADRIAAQSRQAASQLLEQAYNTNYGALTDIYGDFYYLWTKDPVIQEALTATILTPAQEAAVSDVLDSVAFRDILVYSAYLLNRPAGHILSNMAAPASLADTPDSGAIALFTDFYQNYASYINEVFFPRRMADGRNLISIVLAAKSADGSMPSGLIVNIDQSRLSSLINVSPSNGSMLIVNHTGRIISDLDSSMLGQKFPESDLYSRILADPGLTGSVNADYRGQMSLITFKKADTLGFVFLNIIPASQLLEPVRQTNQLILLLFSGAILLSLAVAILSTRQIYRPLNRLIRAMQQSPAVDTESNQDEYTYLGAAFGSLLLQNQQTHLARLLQGQIRPQTLEILGLTHSSFQAIAVLPDQSDVANRDILEQLAQLIQQNLRLPTVVVSGNCVGLLFNADHFDPTETDWIMAQLAGLQQAIEAELRLTVAIGLGSSTDGTEGIRASWRSALAAAQQAAAIGQNQIVPFSEIEGGNLSASQNRASIAIAIDEQIQANYHRPDFSLDEIADKMGLSIGYLRQIYKLERGLPINEQIIATRIDRARELLTTTTLTAREISERVGYLDSRYFYTLFKKRVGMTTDEYRHSTC